MSVIDTQRFAELGEVWSRRKPAPRLAELCEISFQAANSYRVLHLRGLCYRDISKGNLMFDSRTGEVLICDNDNVTIPLAKLLESNSRLDECLFPVAPFQVAHRLYQLVHGVDDRATRQSSKGW